MKLVATLVGVAIVASAIVGCGGGDDDGDLTKAEYAKQADAICVKAATRRDKAVEVAVTEQEKANKKLSSKAFGEQLITDVALPELAQMTEELGELGEPDEDGDKASAMVSAFESGIEEAEADPAGALEGDDPLKGAKKLAKELGANACTQI